MSSISRPLLKAPLAGTPQESAIAYNNRNAEAQANLANAVGGYKRRATKKRRSKRMKRNKRTGRARRGGGGQPAPYMAVPYPVTGAGGQDPNSIMFANAKNQNQAAANSVYDKEAANMKGGFLKRGFLKPGLVRKGGRSFKKRFPKRSTMSKKKK